VTVSGRRSYIDGLLAPLLNQQTTNTIQLPRYADVQARVQHRLANENDLDVMFLVSDDRTSIDAEGQTGPDASSFLVLSFLKALVRWRAPLPGGWVAEQSVLVGPENQELSIYAEDGAFSRGTTVAVRSELTRPVPEGGVVGWRVGIDASAQSEDFRYDFEESAAVVVFAAPEEGSAVALYPGAYVEQTQRAGNLEGVPGVRVDAMLLEDRSQGTRRQSFAVDPRLALRYRFSDATRLHGTVGRYSQFPQIRELLPDANGNPDLRPEWALATSLGAEQQLTPEWSVEATVYQSWLYDVIVGREDRFEFQLGPLVTGPVDTGAYANAGSGSITGLETLVRWEDSRTTAWVGLTLSRSLRRGRLTDEVVRFRYDQPVIGTAVVSHALPRSWQLGARFRYGSGNPYYTVSNRSYSLDRRRWVPLFSETPSRLPAFWSLDLRVDKRIVFRTWALTTYLDLLNATNRRNQELVNWTADYTEEVPVYGLPIIPAFGVRGEW
jgi:hypothetical protein